jgi:porin
MTRQTLTLALLLSGTLAAAYEFEMDDTEVSVSGVASFTGQCGAENCAAAFPLQPELSLLLAGSHEVFAKFGFASGNGLNATTPFNIAPWAADLEDDVQSISGRSRNYLLTAWYKHTANLGSESTLETSAGIIDATDYLDGNAFSNDEYTQFMNSALVNGPNIFLPSYDRGLALEWAGKRWSATGVYMNVGENDGGNPFNYLGAQVAYRLDTARGEGNYRLLLDATDEQFLDPTRTSLERCGAVLVSLDQELGAGVGVFARFAWQSDDAAVDYSALCSGGINLGGRSWSRERDNVGLGYAYLTGGNGDLIRSQVMETYYRAAVNRWFAITADVQYMSDDRRGGGSPSGFIFGLRLTAEF